MKTDDINRMIQQMTDRLQKDDPVRHCDVYKAEGCTHVDGFLCDMGTCDILEKFRSEHPAPKKIYEANRVSKSPLEKGKNG